MYSCPNCDEELTHPEQKCPTCGDEAFPASPCSPKIVQILIAPNDAWWQSRLIGLGDDGVTYHAGTENVWEPLISPLSFQQNTEIAHSEQTTND